MMHVTRAAGGAARATRKVSQRLPLIGPTCQLFKVALKVNDAVETAEQVTLFVGSSQSRNVTE